MGKQSDTLEYGKILSSRASAYTKCIGFSIMLKLTYITPAVDAFHFPHEWYPGMPVVTVLVVVLAKFAVPQPVGLHHVAVLQARGRLLLLWTLLTAVRGITPHGMTAGQHWTRDLLTVYLSRRPLWT